MGFSVIDKDGYIYIVSNPAMPGGFFTRKRYLKIGMTMDIRSRLKALSGTSVPLPFVVEHLLYVPDRFVYESVIHQQLDKYRVSDDREYFYLSPKKAISLIHGKRSKVFELAQRHSKVEEKKKTVWVSNGASPINVAKDRDPTSTKYDNEYRAKLALVRADIDSDSGKIVKFTAEKAKEFGLNNKRWNQAKIDLKKEKYLIQVGTHYYAKTADIPTKK